MERGVEETIQTDKEVTDEGDNESGDDLGPSPPDSPIPSVAAFNLDEEFFAIASSNGMFYNLILASNLYSIINC